MIMIISPFLGRVAFSSAASSSRISTTWIGEPRFEFPPVLPFFSFFFFCEEDFLEDDLPEDATFLLLEAMGLAKLYLLGDMWSFAGDEDADTD